MISQQHSALQDDPCPIADAKLGEMYRASPSGLDELVATVPPAARALLALYCFRRGHLAAIGLAIAATCEEHDLSECGQNAGQVLFERSQATTSVPERQVPGRRQITLATGSLRQFNEMDDSVS